jgi:uncharacterized protein (TIGR02145 family)
MGHRILYIPKRNLFTPIEYGLLYNYPVINGTGDSSIANIGWRIMTYNEAINFITYLGGESVAGGKLKETGTTYWDTPNEGATNEYGFNLRGCGWRVWNDGTFNSFLDTGIFWVGDYSPSFRYYRVIAYFDSTVGWVRSINAPKEGASIRLRKDSTTLSDGETATYTGNDGKVYRTICINGVEYLADNLSETRFYNGDIIPWYGADVANFFTNAEWAALTTAGCCAYDNDINNVAPGFSFPT